MNDKPQDDKTQDDKTPDWPPRRSAVGLPEGELGYGSTGQLWAVNNGQWIRVRLGKQTTSRTLES